MGGRSKSRAVLAILLVFGSSSLCGCARSVSTENGVVTFLIETMPTSLDPRIGTDSQSERINSLIFSGLLELDPYWNVQGDLAEKWEVPNPLTYIFHLRAGVKFHDGRPLTSADVKYTFESILDGTVASPKRGAFIRIQSIDTPDSGTVVFHLKEPFAEFLWNVARPAMEIVPAGAGAGFASHPVGSGPFRFVSAQQDDHVVIERNAAYFGPVPKLTRVHFRVVPEAVVRALELRKGTADLEVNSLTPDMIDVMRSRKDIAVTQRPGTNYDYIGINFQDPTLAKREVRQALEQATDREEIMRYLLRGQARLADGPLPDNNWAYEPNIARYSYDPREAERLLDVAGLPRRSDDGGMRATFTMKTSTEESTRLLSSVLREQWRKVGIRLELRPMELATLFSDITRGSFELYTLRWIGANNDPDIFEFVFSSKRIPPAGANRQRYRNPALDSLLDQARVEVRSEKRKELFSEIQRIVALDLPYLSLWFRDNVCVHRARVRDIRLTPSGDYDFLREIEAR